MTKQEYLDMCQKLLDAQYNEDDSDNSLKDTAWIPAEPEAKLKMRAPLTSNIIDLTNMKKDKITEYLCKGSLFKIHNFTIKTRDFDEENNLFHITLYEDRIKTPSGQPCKMTYPLDVGRDTRFTGRLWLNYFFGSGWGKKIPLETMVEIVRFLQIIKKLSAFI